MFLHSEEMTVISHFMDQERAGRNIVGNGESQWRLKVKQENKKINACVLNTRVWKKNEGTYTAVLYPTLTVQSLQQPPEMIIISEIPVFIITIVQEG